jgi:hypothetical protein
MGQQRPPTGFELALPETWEVVETPPRESWRLTLGDAPVGLASASCRLRQVEQARYGTCLRARYLDVLDGVPSEAEVTIGFYSIGTANDPAAMLAELSDGGAPGGPELVELPAGVAVRRKGRRAGGRRAAREGGDQLVQQIYLPIPGTTDEVAFFGFSSPTVDREAELRELFDDVGAGLSFSWSDQLSSAWEPATAVTSGMTGAVSTAWPAEDRGLHLGAIARSALGGWPGRFGPLAHIAVGLWILAALVYVGQAVTALNGGDAGLAWSRLFKAGFYVFFGLFGYLFDKPRWGGTLIFWAAAGALWTYFGLTCPEASYFGVNDC